VKAAVYDRYGPPDEVRIDEVPTPVPGAGEILIRVRASTVSAADARIRAARFPAGFGWMARLVFGVTAPRQRILGTDLAGAVEAVGAGVTRFGAGDRVIALMGAKLGGHAEYCVLRETAAVVLAPPGMSWAELASLPFGASAAVHFLEDKAQLKPGERVLIIGASGAVGSAAVQVAKARGAHVTGVARTENHPLLQSLGADATIDYRTEDVTRREDKWDVILDMTGTAQASTHVRLLSPGGRLILGAGDLWQTLGAAFSRPGEGRRIIAGPSPDSASLLARVAAMAAAGTLGPVIDRCYPLASVVEAHAHVDTGRKRGSVVLLIAADAMTPDATTLGRTA
jgi:NADPH:quinone reductase-like Zn-dependent oxidoreductase